MSVAPGEKVGLVGRNGSGKTSLMRILAGHHEADSGDVTRRRLYATDRVASTFFDRTTRAIG